MVLALVLAGTVLIAGAAPESAGQGEQGRTVTVDGIGALQGEAVARARDEAIEDALRRAVEQVIGTYIDSETQVENMQVISDKILSKARGFVEGYEILDEKQVPGLYRVRVRATMATRDVESNLRAIGLLYDRVGKPRILVVIPETHIGRRATDPAAETEIIRRFLREGFKVVDQAQVKKIREGESVRRILDGDVKAAQILAKQFDAEILVVGEAFSESAGAQSDLAGLYSCRARIEARGIRADTGDILTADGAFASGLDLTDLIAGKKALTQAGSKWVDSALPILLDRWGGEASGANSVEIVVSGLSFADLARFKEVLSTQVRGVADMQQRNFAATTATIAVDYRGAGQSLADDLALKDFGHFSVEITSFTPNHIEMKVRAHH